jgi:hypothetical protein
MSARKSYPVNLLICLKTRRVMRRERREHVNLVVKREESGTKEERK